jgi:hypothetical protein
MAYKSEMSETLQKLEYDKNSAIVRCENYAAEVTKLNAEIGSL